MTQLLSLLLATALMFGFGLAFAACVTRPRDSDGPIAASLVGFIFAALWLGSVATSFV